MKLTHVTFTGADDFVDPQALLDLSAEFPLIEWGILFSVKRQASPRFPSTRWVYRLMEMAPIGTRFSAHLCGQYVRDVTTNGDLTWADLGLWYLFDRIQLNFHAEPHAIRLVSGYSS